MRYETSCWALVHLSRKPNRAATAFESHCRYGGRTNKRKGRQPCKRTNDRGRNGTWRCHPLGCFAEIGIDTESVLENRRGAISPPVSYDNGVCCQAVRSSPQKNRATVPGPVWLPMVVPTLYISTLPLSCGNRASTRSATALASS